MWMEFYDNMAITLDGHVMPQSQLLWHPRLLLDQKRLSTLTYYIRNWTKKHYRSYWISTFNGLSRHIRLSLITFSLSTCTSTFLWRG
jgi:hypothetical protein